MSKKERIKQLLLKIIITSILIGFVGFSIVKVVNFCKKVKVNADKTEKEGPVPHGAKNPSRKKKNRTRNDNKRIKEEEKNRKAEIERRNRERAQRLRSIKQNRTIMPGRHLTKQGGVCNYNGFIEKWYSQRVLRGGGLNIPGRHVTPDGLVRDKDGFIVVATKHFNKGTVLNISLGRAKVYDRCPIDRVIDVYTNW